jgi:hypothetical protein
MQFRSSARVAIACEQTQNQLSQSSVSEIMHSLWLKVSAIDGAIFADSAVGGDWVG